MSTTWLKNFFGFRITDYEKLMIPNAGAEFCIHVTLKSIQTGTLLGSVLGPLSAVAFSDNAIRQKTLRESFVSGGTNGALIGAAMGPIITYIALKQMNSVQLYDKCYRQRIDQSQLWLDRSTVLSATFGLLTNGAAGFVVGLDIAQLMHSIAQLTWSK